MQKLIISILIGIGISSCTLSALPENEAELKLKHLKDSLEEIKTNQKKELVEHYFTNLIRNTSFNGGALVAYKGTVIYKEVHGLANKKKKTKLTLDTRFQLASVSKQFTSAAIMLLFQDSLLALDDNIKRFIPNFPYKGITIRRLLTHRSGLSNYMYFSETLTNRKEVIYNDDVVKLMIQHKPNIYLPANNKYDYCNTNYALLASVVEIISGLSFNEFIKTRIFNVLEMNDSFLFIKGKTPTTEKTATGYHYQWTEAYHTYQEGVLGDKGIYSTLGDLFKWDRALYSEKLLKKETIKQMFEAGSPDLETTNYGFGWRIPMKGDFKGVVFHSGWYRGFNTIIARDLKTENTIILLSNVRTKIITHTYREIYEILRAQ